MNYKDIFRNTRGRSRGRRKKTYRRHKYKYLIGGGIEDSYLTDGGKHKIHSKSQHHFINLPCSPFVKYSKKITKPQGSTCYPIEVLNNLRNHWNHNNPNDIISSMVPSYKLYDILKHKMDNTCRNEKCWAKVLDPSNDYSLYFVPNRPAKWEQNINTWLSTIDIWKVLKQYEEAIDHFTCIYPSPIDFDVIIKDDYKRCVSNKLCKFKLNEYYSKGYTKIGMVFNTDTHDNPGEHWISLFVNIPGKLLYFFDSAGDTCPDQIMELVNRIILQGKELNISLRFDQNYPMVHQHTTTECGMYSLYFIINMALDQLNPADLKKFRIPDEKITKLRNSYFIPYNV